MNKCFMKFNFVTLLFVMAIAFLGFEGCQKEKIQNNPSVENIGNHKDLTYARQYEPARVPIDMVKPKIEAYLAKYRNSVETRTGETFSIPDAVWMLEAVSNYDHGDANVRYDQLKMTKHYVNMQSTLENGVLVVTETELNSKIAEVANWVVQDRNALTCSADFKKTILVDATPYTDANGNLVMGITIGTGTQNGGGCFPTIDPQFYDPCDVGTYNWHGQGDLGTCNDPASGPTTGNASDIFEAIINSFDDEFGCISLFRISYDPGGNGFFANQYLSDIIIPENHPNPNDVILDGYRDYLLWKTDASSSYGFVNCLTPIEMDFYLDGAVKVMRKELISNPYLEGLDFMMCEIDDTVLSGDDALHLMKILAGEYIE